MAWRVEFGDHSNAADASELDDVQDVLFAVDMIRTERSLLIQIGISVRLKGKRLVIGHVPMEDVELVVHHGVQMLLDHRYGHVVSSCVD